MYVIQQYYTTVSMNLPWYIIYILSLFFGGKKMTWYCIYKCNDNLRKINNYYKILKNKSIIRISYSYESY